MKISIIYPLSMHNHWNINMIKSIKVLSHENNIVKVQSFRYQKTEKYWEFWWFENKEDKEKDCYTSAIFPDEFVEIDGKNEFKISYILKFYEKLGHVSATQIIKKLNQK
jgi:hypothetical protein